MCFRPIHIHIQRILILALEDFTRDHLQLFQLPSPSTSHHILDHGRLHFAFQQLPFLKLNSIETQP
jgi:hypothetical protein